jgi:hypothetical protein
VRVCGLEAVLKNSDSSCRRDGIEVTIKPVGMLSQQVGLREMLVRITWGNSPFL